MLDGWTELKGGGDMRPVWVQQATVDEVPEAVSEEGAKVLPACLHDLLQSSV